MLHDPPIDVLTKHMPIIHVGAINSDVFLFILLLCIKKHKFLPLLKLFFFIHFFIL